jgi:hypothetical protein
MFKKNKFIYYGFAVTIIICIAFVFITENKDLSSKIASTFSTSKNIETVFTEGTQKINLIGAFYYKNVKFKYMGSFQESFLNVGMYDKGSMLAVKKVSSGLISFDYNKNPVTLRIDYTDSHDQNKKENKRDYIIKLEYKDIKRDFKKTVYFKESNENTLYQLDIPFMAKEAGILK